MLVMLQLPTFPNPPRNPAAEIRKPGLNIWLLLLFFFFFKAEEITLKGFSFICNTEGGRW